MKLYTLEPTYKKSVCEVEHWRKRSDILPADDDQNWYNWNGPILRKECWWRWAEWSISIPETEEEIKEFIQERGFDTLDNYLENHGAESIEDILLPDEEKDEHIVPSEAECNYCWDGQYTEFKIAESRNLQITDNEQLHMESEAMRLYFEEQMYEEGLESLGWEHYSTTYEVYCTMKSTLQETEEEKLKRDLLEFSTKLKADFNEYPEKFGCLFDQSEDDNETKYNHVAQKFGTDKILQVIDDCLPIDSGISFEGILVQPFVVAALCNNSELDVIYHLLRKSPINMQDRKRNIDNKN